MVCLPIIGANKGSISWSTSSMIISSPVLIASPMIWSHFGCLYCTNVFLVCLFLSQAKACIWGSIIKGYLVHWVIITAFSVENGSEGKPSAFILRISASFVKVWTKSILSVTAISFATIIDFHFSINFSLKNELNTPI